jgi:hypothetical protein
MTDNTTFDPPNYPPNTGSIPEQATGGDFSNGARLRGEFLTYDDVEGRLIEAVQLQWRTEGGSWPFAGDGPWHLIRKEWEDWDARDPKPMPRVPLSKAELMRMREAFGWLLLVPEDTDRRLVLLSVTERAKGPKRVPWARVAKLVAGGHEPDALRMRYRRAMGALTGRVNVASLR